MPDICIAVVDLIQNLCEIPVIVEVRESPSVLQKLRDLILNIITGHITDLVSFHMLFRGEAFDRVHTALNVHASRVGTDLDPLLPGFLACFL